MSKQYKAFMVGMGFGALLMFILLFPSTLTASDENGDEFCLAQNIYFEAGNQPLAGKIAVAQVVMNRLEHHSYPGNICGVVYDAKWKVNWAGNMMPVRNQCQFSWFCDGKSDEPLDTKTFDECLIIARDIVDGFYPDITEGATHYHNVYVNPYWSDSLNETVIINEHIFYK
jgi:spore germination cell wall hydrolase CwlJ-like protein